MFGVLSRGGQTESFRGGDRVERKIPGLLSLAMTTRPLTLEI